MNNSEVRYRMQAASLVDAYKFRAEYQLAYRLKRVALRVMVNISAVHLQRRQRDPKAVY